MFSLFKNLLKTQIKASQNKGVDTKRHPKNWFQEFACNKIPKNKAPRKVLPTSPINTFAGDQFRIKNPIKTAIIGYKLDVISIVETDNIIIMHAVTIPSIPSIKLVKFIIASPQRNKVKNIEIKNNWLLKSKFKFENLNKTKTVKIWEKNLLFEDRFNLSSIKPTNARGIQINGM